MLLEINKELLANLLNILEPIRATVEEICSNDANLLTTDIALNFMLGELHSQSFDIAFELYKQLKIRI